MVSPQGGDGRGRTDCSSAASRRRGGAASTRNCWLIHDDWTIVNCADCRTVLSSVLDGEAGVSEQVAATAHLEACDACCLWHDAARRLHRMVRVQPAEGVPDLTAGILARAHPPDLGRGEWTRTALAIVALTELVLAVPALFGHDTGASVHLARHIGALTAALALGYLYAAWRPVRAFGLLPVAAGLAVTMTVTALLDVTQGRAQAAGESTHLLDVAALVLLWMLAGRPRWSVSRRWASNRAVPTP
jgi:predicted anti-sigma-YlaC factor YlaD